MHDAAPSQLPPVSRAVISAEELSSLVRDLRALAAIEHVVLRSAASRMGEVIGDGPAALKQALAALNARTAAAVQVRYVHEGARWVDTIAPHSDGFSLTRMRLPPEAHRVVE